MCVCVCVCAFVCVVVRDLCEVMFGGGWSINFTKNSLLMLSFSCMVLLYSHQLKSDLESVCRQAFGNRPPFLGVDKPIHIVASLDQRPRTIVNPADLYDPSHPYLVAISCEAHERDRFVYQYSHELFHLWSTPVEHPFLEVCAVAVSLHCLTRFQYYEYRQRVVSDALGQLELDFPQQLWEADFDESELFHTVTVGPATILLAQALEERVLSRFDDWSPFCTLAGFIGFENGKGLVLFDEWRESATNPSTERFVEEIQALFAHTYGSHLEPSNRVTHSCSCHVM